MTALSLAGGVHRERLALAADWLVVAIAAALPWSTSAVSILLVIWLIALIPTLSWGELRRVLATPAGALPVLLVLLGLLGTAWADVSLLERWKGLTSFLKLLVILPLLIQFSRSPRALTVFTAYVAACVALLAATAIAHEVPALTHLFKPDEVLVKNAATQSNEFVTCIFGLLFVAVDCVARRRWLWLGAIIVVILAMLANMFLMSTGRTALVIIPFLLLLLAAKKLDARGMAVVFVAAVVLAAAGWFSSPYLRSRIDNIWVDLQAYQTSDQNTSTSERLEFWKKSLQFIGEAPVLGHGTGTITALFEQSAAGQTGLAGTVATNPHNQTFAVAIQLGVLGAVVLWAMWIAHLLLFRGGGLIEWVGLIVVAQNILGSLFNSHLFDFVQGWVYVVGVGVAGGAALKRVLSERAA